MADTRFYILDQDFNTVYFVDQYISILWVDRYNQPGDFELIAPPLTELFQYAVIGNYLWSSDSDRLMFIEKLELTTSVADGAKVKITGRSLESILSRRIFLYKTYFRGNLEDAIRQCLDWCIINPSDSSRKISNFVFEYSHDERINTLETKYQYEKGSTVEDSIKEIIEGAHLGYKITFNESTNQFIFKLYIGDDRSYDQDSLPWVVFSPKHNNLITNSFTFDGGESYKNVMYVEGDSESGTSSRGKTIITGDATGLDRREGYYSASDIQRKFTDEMTGEEVELTDEEYEEALQLKADEVAYENDVTTTVESEVEPRIGNAYGTDYFMGDIVQVENEFGIEHRIRVTEFITQYDSSGKKQYPTFTGVGDEEDV